MKFSNIAFIALSIFISNVTSKSIQISQSSMISTDGTCGPENSNKICPDNQCCGEDGKCGFDKIICGKGCQESFGYCLPEGHEVAVCMACVECVDCDEDPEMALLCPSTCIKYKKPNPKPYTPPPFEEVTTTISEENKPTPTPEISTDGTCGPQNGNKICPGDECCGEDGKCGFNKTVCGEDCQEGFGYCLPKDKGIPVCVACHNCIDCDKDPEQRLLCPSTCKGAEIDPEEGTCGPEHGGKVCPGNQCCGKDGKCGFTKYICGNGCQEGFGYCLPGNYNSQGCPDCYRCFECSPQMKLLCPTTCKN